MGSLGLSSQGGILQGLDGRGRRKLKGFVVSQSLMHQEIAVEGFAGCWGELEPAQVGGRQHRQAVALLALQSLALSLRTQPWNPSSSAALCP